MLWPRAADILNSMRSFFLNLLTIIFVGVTIYLVVKSDFPDFAKNFLSDSSIHFALPDFSAGAPTLGEEATPETKITPGNIALPGPLAEIKDGSAASSDAAGTLTVKGIIVDTNAERQKNAIGSLRESHALDASAKVKAEDILARQYFEHTAPDGKTVSDLVTNEGYDYIRIGENLALGNFKNDLDVVTAWMNSPGHRANILDGRFTDIGVGVAFGLYQGHYVSVAVQHFGRPRSSCPAVDEVLKNKVTAGQAELTDLATSLEALQKAIEEGRSQGKDMNAETDLYNSGVEKYQERFKEVDALRKEYNAEVAAFNACIDSMK